MQSETRPDPLHSVLILTYTKPELAKQRVEEVARFLARREDVELIVFNNGGGTSTNLPLIFDEAAWVMSYKLASTAKNVGFGGGWNKAVNFACGENLYLLSDDVQVTGDFIAPISKHLKDGVLIGQDMIDHAAGWNEFGPFRISYLMGYFYSITRNTWDELGGFDAETFYPYDYEDVDLSLRAERAGMQLMAMHDLPLIHSVAGTIGYNSERYENTVLQRARFAEKHGLPNVPERP